MSCNMYVPHPSTKSHWQSKRRATKPYTTQLRHVVKHQIVVYLPELPD
jgi:hypothetical protein